jgi:hypothetical protein
VRVAEKKTTFAAETPSPPYAMRKRNFLLGFLKGVSRALPAVLAAVYHTRIVAEQHRHRLAQEEERRLAHIQQYNKRREETNRGMTNSYRQEIHRWIWANEPTKKEEEACCAICLASCGVDDGVKCAGDEHPDESDEHFMCSGCLDRYVRMKLEETERNTLVVQKGQVCCPLCSAHIVGFAKHISDELHAQYLDAFSQGMSEELEQQFDIRVQQRVDALRNELEKAHLVPNSIDERVKRAEIHVIEEILTVKCPRCSQAFVDFDGCFALQCSRCAAGICGWCMADCGADSHAHVVDCPANRYRHQRDPFFGNFKYFEQARMRERLKRLDEFLYEELEPELWGPVHQRLVPHLNELGIELDLVGRQSWWLRSQPDIGYSIHLC